MTSWCPDPGGFHPRRAALPALLAAALAGVGGSCETGSVSDPALEGEHPFEGRRLFVERGTPAARTADAWRRSRPADAALLDRIAARPQAIWLAEPGLDVAEDVARYMDDARRVDALPVFVAYNIPVRDCSEYAAGGAGSAEAYRAWIDAVADAIGDREAVVVLEPDALAGADCLSAGARAARTALLREAVAALKRGRRTAVYIDAGHPRWLEPEEIAERLREVDVTRADGFALNVSNFVPTEETIAYGDSLATLLGGAHYVIDTSRNGRGAPPPDDWCNPPGRGLGTPPTVASGRPRVDALLWIKSPGESDGTCNGGPPAGIWWPEYALELARRATSRSGP